MQCTKNGGDIIPPGDTGMRATVFCGSVLHTLQLGQLACGIAVHKSIQVVQMGGHLGCTDLSCSSQYSADGSRMNNTPCLHVPAVCSLSRSLLQCVYTVHV